MFVTLPSSITIYSIAAPTPIIPATAPIAAMAVGIAAPAELELVAAAELDPVAAEAAEAAVMAEAAEPVEAAAVAPEVADAGASEGAAVRPESWEAATDPTELRKDVAATELEEKRASRLDCKAALLKE